MLQKLKGFFTTGVGLPTVFSACVLLSATLYLYLLPAAGRTVDTVSKVVEMTALTIGLLSLVLIARQTRTTAKWNKLLSYHQFFGEITTRETVRALHVAAEKCNFKESMKSGQAIDVSAVDSLCNDDDSTTSVCFYLDEFEEFCGAVAAGVVDSGYAYTLEATRVIRVWAVFEPYVARRRSEVKYSRCYLELQRLASTWKAQRELEEKRNHDESGVRTHV